MAKKPLKMVIVSDGTGETARGLVEAAMAQFKDFNLYLTRYKNVVTKEQIQGIFTEVTLHYDLVVYTIVQAELREYIAELARAKEVWALDCLGPVLGMISNYLNQEPGGNPGLLRAVNDDYFKRMEAMEFTLNHDDGQNLDTLHSADIVLLGISRTSKTPLSLYLSQHGHKVVNVPMVYGMDLPKELFEIDQRKIFGLTIDAGTLEHIRKNRLSRLGSTRWKASSSIRLTGDYADSKGVSRELEWAEQIFKENKRWPVFNVTGKAIEETASEIMKLIAMRRNNIFKQKMME